MTDTAAPTQRRYRFADHAPSGYPRRWSAAPPREPDQIPPLTLSAIINRENLVRTFKRVRDKAGPAAGIDGYRYWDYSISEIGDVADVVCGAIHAGNWRPSRSRVKPVPKHPRGTRRLDIRCTVDRLVSAAVCEPVTHALDSHLLPTSFGFRPGRGVHSLLAILAHYIEHEGYCVVAHDDIANAFPSLRIDDALRDYAALVEDPGLLRLIEAILRGHTGSPVGIEQGDPLSPPTMNLRLHHCLDLPSLATTDPGTPLRLRYADDLVYLTRSVTDGQRALDADGALLRPTGFHLKERRNYPVDLRRSGSSTQVLGLRISLASGRVRYEIDSGATRRLSEALRRAHELPDSTAVADAVVQGWINGYGPAVESCGAQRYREDVQRALRCAGSCELGSPRRLNLYGERAVEHWRLTRQAALYLYLPGLRLLRAPQRSTGP